MRIIAVVAALAIAFPALAAENPRVIDGDTIVLDSVTYRLEGIDAPERGQHCSAHGILYACGTTATAFLRSFIADKPVTCNGHARDRYGRVLGHCYADGEDVSRAMVRNGWALAYTRYSNEYVDDEKKAEAESLGLHRGEYVEPWEWRTLSPAERRPK